MFRNRSADVHQFAMVPRADIPRSRFRMQKTLKTTFDAGYLIPVFVEEILPGDTFKLKMTAFCRMATPIFPVMDNLYLDSFFFFVPNRLVWDHWEQFMGQQNQIGDSTSYTIPQVVSKAGGYDVGSIFDMMGLPTAGQITGSNTYSHSALPLRAYQRIFNEWFRDENVVYAETTSTGDGPDLYTAFTLRRRGKRHDYFTSALPFLQKGTAVGIPLTGSATVLPAINNTSTPTFKQSGTGSAFGLLAAAGNAFPYWTSNGSTTYTPGGSNGWATWASPGLIADLSTATAVTINALRQSFQIQKLLERDARGGTRYTEIVRSHFGVVSPDSRLQRPEYLGGGSNPITVNPIAQTSATGVTGGSTPVGTLSAFATSLSHNHGFSQSFVEHGYVLGLVNVRADLTYQQGLRRHWSRQTRYDFYFPVFATLGEQAILNKEIYCQGTSDDALVFGYQERWAEYRYNPSEICGLFKSTASGTIDAWHLSQKFTALPTLNQTFMEDTPPLSRVLAVGAAANGQQMLCDAFFDIEAARPMPMYSVPGLVDHF